MKSMLKVPLKSPNYLLILIIAFSLGVDYLVYGTVYPLAIFSPAGIQREAELSLLSGCYAVGVLISTFTFILLGARLGCRRPMIFGSLVLATATLMIALAPSLTTMVIGRTVQGIAAGITWTTGLSIVAEHFTTKRVEMMGFAFMGSTAGSVAGPSLAGWLYEVGGYQLPFAVVLCMITVNVLLLFFFLPKDLILDFTVPNFHRLLSDPAILFPAFALFLAAAAWGILEPVAPLLLSNQGIGPPLIGIILTSTTAAYGLSAPLVSFAVRQWGSNRVMLLGAVGLALAIPLTGALSKVILVFVALCLVNIMYAFTLNPASAAMGDAIEARGLNCYTTVYAIYSIVYAFGQMGASALATAVLSHFNLLSVLIGFGALLMLSVPLMHKLSRLRVG